MRVLLKAAFVAVVISARVCTASLPGLLGAYNRALLNHPVASNMATGAVVLASGDVMAQRFIERRQGRGRFDRGGNDCDQVVDRGGTEETDITAASASASAVGFDWRRTRNAAVVGVLWSGLCSPKIYNAIDTLVGAGAKGLRPVAIKMLLVTAVMSVPGNYINMSMRRLLADQGYRDPAAAFAAVNANFKEVVLADWKVWPLYDTLCFAVIPRHLRGATTVCANCAWGCYISTMANKKAGGAESTSACSISH